MLKALAGLLISSRIPKRPLGDILKKHVFTSSFTEENCGNRSRSSVSVNKQLNVMKVVSEESTNDAQLYDGNRASYPCSTKVKFESQKGNSILHSYLNSQRDFAQIQETMTYITEDLLLCGLPYNLDSQSYDELVQDAIRNVNMFASDELMYFANLHLHTNQDDIDKSTQVLVEALKAKLKDFTIYELSQLTEMLMVTNIEVYCEMREYIREAVAQTIDQVYSSNKDADKMCFRTMCSVLRLCAYMPIHNTDKYLDYLLTINPELEPHVIYSEIFSGFTLENCPLLSDRLSQNKEIILSYNDDEYVSLKRTLYIIYNQLLHHNRKYTANFIDTTCSIINYWSDLLPFFFSHSFLKNSFYSSVHHNDAHFQLDKSKMFFATYCKQGWYDENSAEDLVLVVNQLPTDFRLIKQFAHVLALQNVAKNSVDIAHTFKTEELPPSSCNINVLFDLIYLNLDENLIPAAYTEKTVANYITEGKSVQWKDHITANHASFLHKLCLLLDVIRKRNPSTQVGVPLFLSGMVQTANKLLFDECHQQVDTTDMDVINKIVNYNFIPNVVYNNKGVIDALIVLDEYGSPRNVKEVVDHRSDLSYHNLNLDRNDIRIAVLNVTEDDFVMKSKHLRLFKKCLEEYLTSEGFSVILNCSFLPENEKEFHLKKKFLLAGMNCI